MTPAPGHPIAVVDMESLRRRFARSEGTNGAGSSTPTPAQTTITDVTDDFGQTPDPAEKENNKEREKRRENKIEIEREGNRPEPVRNVRDSDQPLPPEPDPLPSPPIHVVSAPVEFRHVTDRAELPDIAERLAVADCPVAIDIETCGPDAEGALDPFRPGTGIRIVSLAVPGMPAWVIDLRAVGGDLGPVGEVLRTGEVVGHNLKFDLLWLGAKLGLDLRDGFCTMTASRLLTAGTEEPNDLGAALLRHLGIEVPKDQGRSDWGGLFLTTEQLRYAANDVAHLLPLRAAMESSIASARLGAVMGLEMRLLPAIVDMEHAGFPVDAQKLRAIESAERAESERLAALTRAALGDPAINLASPVQVKAAFHRLGHHIDKTGADDIVALDCDAARLLVEHRAHEGVARQARTLIESIAPDGRIHARFEPTGAETGRFSSKNPNLQNVSRGELRGAFVAPPGKRLVVADYSQIELRGAAAISGDAAMLDACRRGEDLHRKTAALVLCKPEADVTPADRQLAKPVNFALCYGQSPGGLARYARNQYGVAMTPEEATLFRERFFASYRGISSWHHNAWELARHNRGSAEDCQMRTRLGRRRLLPRDGDKDWQRFAGLVNGVVQGTCADGMKLALARLCEELPGEARIIATVHDEVVIEAPEGIADPVREATVEIMRSAMAELLPEVPIEVEVKVCGNWGEK